MIVDAWACLKSGVVLCKLINGIKKVQFVSFMLTNLIGVQGAIPRFAEQPAKKRTALHLVSKPTSSPAPLQCLLRRLCSWRRLTTLNSTWLPAGRSALAPHKSPCFRFFPWLVFSPLYLLSLLLPLSLHRFLPVVSRGGLAV